MKRLLSEYWLTILLLFTFAILVRCNIEGTFSEVKEFGKDTTYAKSSTSLDLKKNGGYFLNKEIDCPAPLKNVPEQILIRTGYILSYNTETKLPNWVAWHLTSEHVSGTYKRPGNAWHEDKDVPLPRATRNDYRDTKWSHGHMCPAGDNKWDKEAMYETFLLSNCCPQNARLNSGDWNEIEIACRRWAKTNGDIYIVCGPILLHREHETIGENEVVVPEAFFKVVACLNDSPKGIGFICRNTDGNQKKDFYVNTISQIERVTGITFFPSLRGADKKLVKEKADIKEWN